MGLETIRQQPWSWQQFSAAMLDLMVSAFLSDQNLNPARHPSNLPTFRGCLELQLPRNPHNFLSDNPCAHVFAPSMSYMIRFPVSKG